jgi:hypothetical protein
MNVSNICRDTRKKTYDYSINGETIEKDIKKNHTTLESVD